MNYLLPKKKRKFVIRCYYKSCLPTALANSEMTSFMNAASPCFSKMAICQQYSFIKSPHPRYPELHLINF